MAEAINVGDRVWIAEPHYAQCEGPLLYGEVVGRAALNEKVILVLIDGLEVPIGFYAMQLAANPDDEWQPYEMFRRWPMRLWHRWRRRQRRIITRRRGRDLKEEIGG